MSYRRDSFALLMLLVLALSTVVDVQCEEGDDFSNPAVLQLFTQLLDRGITNITTSISSEFQRRSHFCVKNAEADWNQAFNYSSNLGFLESCIKKTNGDVMRRQCSKSEIKFYFSDFYDGTSESVHYVKPNKNCNLTTWLSGCEPGWACALVPRVDADLNNAKDIPQRNWDCQPCCEGFFCPHGLTCMIPCPLGAYCPRAMLNKTTGVCDPYNYQLPSGQRNHSCGGANGWAGEIFCPAGSYCTTTMKKSPCSSGHYCRMGSTSERPCNKLNSCHQNAAEENLHVYGIMLILALSTLLVIIYNCYDQVLTTRERRLAQTREAAARSAREMARGREKWKSAKEIAKKHASQISRTISRSISTMHSSELKHSGQIRSDSAALLQSMGDASTKLPYVISKEKKKGQGYLMKMMHDIEKNPEDFEGFGVGIGDRNVESSTGSGKEITTHSQIFRYAYAKIEIEKASEEQNKNLTFSRVIAQATSRELRKRPKMEIAFKDLTLTLKGKNKHVLRCVTGKLIPGHITAVMGPSGAGKSTFLYALRGKTAEFKMTGSVFINGKEESIHSYRKIIGFVPQDDIIHGNLTVEENIWFSAKCRLSKDLPKADKFLIVERVIESLGLQDVRDSLVGTVEKRGISGGQRKKVNVGLEMVMEPSLLILDEPTSGLDSTSSLLLLKTLRRETLEGVNVCMVVHQPSYSLFRMFDDLMLLAKGGLTVYHGPVEMVEVYFASLGIHVPERINPPDHYIDFLEGTLKHTSSATVCWEELPARWMLHNKFAVPQDMQHHAECPIACTNLQQDRDAGVNSFLAELWKDLKCAVEVHLDDISHNFLISKDLSNRKTPGFLDQFKHFLSRICKQRLREAKIQAIDYLILLLAGASLGLLTKGHDQTFNASGYMNTVIAMSLLCKVAALRSFSHDKLQYWRESASGMSSLAYFLSTDTVDHFNTLIKPAVYLSTFYSFNSPRSSFAVNYIILVCLVYCVTGMAYVLAVLLVPGLAQLVAVLSPVILALITTQPKDNEIAKHLARFCYTTWGSEAFMISNAERYHGVWLIARCGALLRSGYNVHNWSRCIAWMILAGVVSRTIAFFWMVTSEKKV